ncbi:UDP-N-acetylmuramyl pentapeptide phosphotransferase [Microbacterium sp. YY-01]|uniref:UDP-N-acetylmuramyl pentapeptide phosphotransferase n=1 Tax=Microbacterium sp. YY-01 TaxID=3421634 RepID=UPI003D173D57
MATEKVHTTVTETGTVKVLDFDPARRTDVLFRVRREEGHEVSAWWMVGAFVAFSSAVVWLLSFAPGGA